MSHHLWTENESIDEIKQKLVCTRYELVSTRMEASREIRKYEETVKRLFHLLKTVCEERDEARHQIQVLLRKKQPCPPQDAVTITSKECSDVSSKSLTSRSYDLPLVSRDRTQTTTMADVGPRKDNIMVDRLVCGKPLPQKGRLLRAVTEAGPLLQTLLLAPLPHWQNPPPFDDDHDNVDDVIPTSLSLAFPGNSRMSSSASVDVSSDIVLSNMLTGKKRKLL